MAIPVIVLPFREVNDYEYPSLQQRMDDDYVHAFAPYLLAFRQIHKFSNAYIILSEELYPDQIALLRSCGAFEGQAKTIERIFMPRAKWSGPLYEARFSHYVCLFRTYSIDSYRYADAYIVALG